MPAPCQPYVSPMCPNIEEFVPTRWWWRSQRMLRPVGSSTSRSASTHSSLYQRCYFLSDIGSKIPWQIITFNNCFSKDRSQSRVLDVVRSVTGAFNRSQFKLNRSLKTFSLAASTISLSPFFQGWDCHRSFRWGLVAISEGVWSFFAKTTLIIQNQNHIQFLWQTTLIIQNPKSHFNRRWLEFF